MKLRVLLLIVSLSAISCYGQDTINKNSFTFSFGPGYIVRQDLIFSPFIHTDFSFLNVGLDFTRDADFYQKVSLHYGNFDPMVTAPYDFTVHGETETAYPHNFNVIEIDYLLGKTIKENKKSTLTAGGLFTSDIHAMNYVYGRISSFGYYAAFGFGIFGKNDLAISEKSKVSTTLQLPLFAWLARPPYIGIDDEFIENISSHSGFKTFASIVGDGKLVTWNRLQTVDLVIKYSYQLNEKWDVGAAYFFEFIHSSQPRSLLSFRNSINLSSTLRF